MGYFLNNTAELIKGQMNSNQNLQNNN
jgi:hypothetical protein